MVVDVIEEAFYISLYKSVGICPIGDGLKSCMSASASSETVTHILEDRTLFKVVDSF